LLDSGAFSVWNKGGVIDIDKYIFFAHNAISEAKKHNKKLRIVNLDVIPGKVGQTNTLNKKIASSETLKKNKAIINASAKQGYLNCKIMKSNGITPIHVFHQGEDWKWLNRMLLITDYIGISPANDMPSRIRNNWMISVFEYLYKNGVDIKTHGFAVTSFKILRDLPWESCDAATWTIAAGNGIIFMPHKGYKKPDFSKNPYNYIVSEKQKKNISPAISKLLETSGYSINEIQSDHNIRRILNVKYLKLLQEYLNEYKKTAIYPKKKLQPLLIK